MSEDTTRRSFLLATGAFAVGAGVGAPLLRAALTHHDEHAAGAEAGPRWAMVVDTAACAKEEGCTRCIDACNAVHNVPQIVDAEGKVDPEEEVKWIWKEPFENALPGQMTDHMNEDVRDRDVLVLCNQCDNPPCVRVCPTQATWKRADGIVMMDMHRCIGCRYCLVGCPYGSRSFNFQDPTPYIAEKDPIFPTRSKGVVEKCNFCAEKARHSADGTWTPECVAKCPVNALVFGNIRDPESPVRQMLANREAYTVLRKPELGTKPHVFYVV